MEVSVDHFADFSMCLIPIPLEYTKKNNNFFQFVISWCVFLSQRKESNNNLCQIYLFMSHVVVY
jgi:Fe-S-cluster containining protein